MPISVSRSCSLLSRCCYSWNRICNWNQSVQMFVRFWTENEINLNNGTSCLPHSLNIWYWLWFKKLRLWTNINVGVKLNKKNKKQESSTAGIRKRCTPCTVTSPSITCHGEGVPHPVLDEGYPSCPVPDRGTPSCPVLGRGYPILSWLQSLADPGGSPGAWAPMTPRFGGPSYTI